MSLTTRLNTVPPEGPLTGIVANTKGNVIGINREDPLGFSMYYSPLYARTDISVSFQFDNVNITYDCIVPKLIAASADLSTLLVATSWTSTLILDNAPRVVLYKFTLNGTFPNYPCGPVKLFDLNGNEMTGPLDGSGSLQTGPYSRTFSIAVSPDGSNMYASYTNDNDSNGTNYGILLRHMTGFQGEGFYQVFQNTTLQTINNMVCANGDILYCSHINSSTIHLVLSGTSVTNITDNLTTLNAGNIRGLACSSDGSILYAIDSTNFYQYNRAAPPGMRWSKSVPSVDPLATNLSEIKCDPTGAHIILTGNNCVYFSDDSGLSWQTDTPPNGYYSTSTACPSSYSQFVSYTTGSTVSAATGIYQRIQYLVTSAPSDLTLVNSANTTFNKIVTDSNGVKILALDNTNPANIYISRDSGVTFTILYTLSNTTGFNLIGANGDFTKIVATTESGSLDNDGKLYVSSDFGNTFIQVTEYNVYTYYPPVYPSEPQYNSTPLPNNSTFGAISVESLGNYMAVTCNNESFLVSYDGSSWWGGGFAYSGGTYPQFNSICVADGNKLYCAGSDGKVYTFIGNIYYIDISGFNRVPPTTVTTVSTGVLSSITCSRDGTKVYVTDNLASPANSKIYYSGDTGLTFSTIYDPTESTSVILTKLICDTATGSKLLATDTSGNILVSVDAYLNRTFTTQASQGSVISDITMDYYGTIPYYMDYTSGLYTQPSPSPSYLLLIGNSSRPFYSPRNVLCNSDGSVVYLVDYIDHLLFMSADSGRTYIQDTITFNTNPSNEQAFTSVIGNSSLSYLLFSIKDFTNNNFYLSVFQPPSSLSSNTTGSVTASTVYDSTSTPISMPETEYILQTMSSSGQYMYVINNAIAYRSTNSGLTFTEMSTGCRSIACSSDGSKVYTINVDKSSGAISLKRSTDSGATFTNAPTPPISGNIVSDSTGQILFLSSSTVIYKSTNSGQSWNQVFTNTASFEKLVCDSTGTHLMLYLGAYNLSFLYFSDDGGSTWTLDKAPATPPLGNSIPGMATSASGLKQYTLYRSGLYLRSGTSQTNNSPVSKTITSLSCSADASTVVTLSAYDSTKIYRSTDYGGTLTSLTGITSSVNGITLLATNSDCSKILYATKNGTNSADGRLYLYNGTTSTLQTILDSSGTLIAPPYGIASIVVSGDGNYKYIIHSNNNLYGSSTGSFTYKSTPALQNNCRSVICSYNGSYVFVTTYSLDGKVYISSDNASTFSFITLPKSVKPKYIACDSSGTILFVTTTGSTKDDGIFKVNRSGSTWGAPSQIYSITDGKTIFTDIKCNSSGTYMVATDDIFFSDDGGATWQMVPNPFPSTPGPVGMNSSGSRIYYTFSGSGIFSRNGSGIATPCFLEGTKILCLLSGQETYLAVETLRSGTLVKTPDGFKRVDKIGKSGILNPGHSGRTMDRLYVCKKENFPELTEDLYITGYHSILVDELSAYQNERTLEINGQVFEATGKKCLMASICEKAEPWAQEGTFTIWHFSLEDEDEKTKFGVYSNGLLTETCSVEYMDNSPLHTRLEPVSQVPKHFFNKSLICKCRS